jgi:hypothetical protein
VTCRGCQRIRRALGIKRRFGVGGVNPDKGLFADGLTIWQKMFHIGISLLALSIGLWMIWIAARGLAAAANWVTYLMFGQVV